MSNFKVNYTKTEVLNVSNTDALASHLATVLPFQWQSTSIKYLGTYILRNLLDLYKLNFLPLLTRTLKDFGDYGTRHLSWFGRINVVKMYILPTSLLSTVTFFSHQTTLFLVGQTRNP